MDAGLNAPTASLGNLVFDDLDRDGIQDPGEPGVPGVTVTLRDDTGAPVGSTMTAADGTYSFTGLEPGDYSVAFSNLPSGFVFSPVDQGGDDTTDSDANASGVTPTVTLSPGENDPSWGVGFISPALGEDEATEPEPVNYLYLPWITQ